MALRINLNDYDNELEYKLNLAIYKANRQGQLIDSLEKSTKIISNHKTKLIFRRLTDAKIKEFKLMLKDLKKDILDYYNDSSIEPKKLVYKQFYHEIFVKTGVKV